MKWYYFVAIAIAAIWIFRPKSSSGSSPWWGWMSSGDTTPKTPEEKAADIANKDFWNGFDASKITLADQNLYPGFYTTPFGGYINPETGESYTPGSSPAAYVPSPYETGEAVRPIINTDIPIPPDNGQISPIVY